MLRRTAIILVGSMAVAGFAPAGCSSSSPQCQVGADCASGVCESNGKCGPTSNGHTDSGTVDGDSGTMTADDGGSPGDDSGPVEVSDTGSPFPGVDGGLCVPNNDGTITRNEVPMLAGLHANFEFAENVTVNSAGVMNANGTYLWDLTGPFQPSSTKPNTADHTVLVTTNDPTGQWFSSAFPSATYTTKLSDTANLLGIFQGTSSALQLLGVASPASGNGSTELTYKTPIAVLAVPMTLGSTWTTNSNVTGTAEGILSNYTEEYVNKVDAQGTLKTPYGTFNVLRVQTTLTRDDLGVVQVIRSFSFVAECFGSIASLVSQTATAPEVAPPVDFTDASEVQRLTP
jgi:hypothetical protein